MKLITVKYLSVSVASTQFLSSSFLLPEAIETILFAFLQRSSAFSCSLSCFANAMDFLRLFLMIVALLAASCISFFDTPRSRRILSRSCHGIFFSFRKSWERSFDLFSSNVSRCTRSWTSYAHPSSSAVPRETQGLSDAVTSYPRTSTSKKPIPRRTLGLYEFLGLMLESLSSSSSSSSSSSISLSTKNELSDPPMPLAPQLFISELRKH
mmetsp:Transcript_36144/g.75973  ORF Transcript_36144/g.75973 Transcript_36144/m.75973 type:complete len:210 (-) Transcript_36144:642-1271(-)